MSESFDVNLAHWDERAPAHAASPGYCGDQLRGDPDYLSEVVRFDLPLLGDINGQRGVHLQCHIGTDTVSLARLGAHMTGVDFSEAALAEARRLAADTRADVDFVHSDVYDAVTAVGGPGQFDLVYTGIGALCWLPDIARWAHVAAQLLAPGGRIFVREGHPVLWSLDDTRTDGLFIEYEYFERPAPVVYMSNGTYVPTDATFEHNETHTWNHGIGEIVTALLHEGLTLTGLAEHDSVPWNALPGQMEEIGDGEWRVIDRPWRVPHTYTLQAVKPR